MLFLAIKLKFMQNMYNRSRISHYIAFKLSFKQNEANITFESGILNLEFFRCAQNEPIS
jgi:hypothetical protein